MEFRPFCDLCGHRHFSYEPHVFGKDAAPARESPAPSAKKTRAPKAPDLKLVKAADLERPAADVKGFAPEGQCAYCDARRNAQRALMRRRRAKP